MLMFAGAYNGSWPEAGGEEESIKPSVWIVGLPSACIDQRVPSVQCPRNATFREQVFACAEVPNSRIVGHVAIGPKPGLWEITPAKSASIR